MRSRASVVTFALTLAACGSQGGQASSPTPADSGTAATDTPAPTDSGQSVTDTPAPTDSGQSVTDTPPTPPADTEPAGPTYPGRPYGTGIGAIFEPFTLQNCNAGPELVPWRFDGPDFFTSNLTVLIISAAWCVPCQREAAVLERTLIQPYRGRGVRFVQLLVQNVDRSPATESTCRTWATRYGLTFPELMDPMFITSPFVPRAAFPGNVIIDRQGRIRWREYGTDTGLMSIQVAIDDVLAHPDP